MLFDPTEFHVAGTLAYRHMAMSYQTVFQISVPIAFTFRNSIKMGGNLLGTQTKKKREIFDAFLFSKISFYLY